MHTPTDRPRLTLRVGITGHRSGKLTAADRTVLRARIHETLAALRDGLMLLHQPATSGYSEARPRVVLVSSLASGADSLAAREALALGYELWAPLPFPAATYAEDFETPAERQELEELVASAAAMLELDGDRADSKAAYTRASAVMLGQSDVLIAVWDGKDSLLEGGTGHTIRQAQLKGIPVLSIDAAAPHHVREVASSTSDAIEPPDLPRVIAGILRPLLLPAPNSAGDPLRAAYFDAAKTNSHGFGIFARFRRLMEMGAHPHGPSVAGPPPTPVTESAPRSRIIAADRVYADAAADSYAARYRDAFVSNYLLGALAVLMAVLGFVTQPAPINPVGTTSPLTLVWTIAELGLIATILILTRRGRRGEWHARWLGYRHHAERLRHIELLWPLGRSLSSLRAPADDSEPDAHPTWVAWLTRARAREAGMASGRLSPAYLATYRTELDALLHDQISYHERTSLRNHALAHRLHGLGTALFFVTFLVCVAHLGYEVWHHSHTGGGAAGGVNVNGVLTLLAAVLPAFGAALAGIASQGEFERVSNRSRSIQRQLQALRARLAARAKTSDAYAEIAEDAVAVMSDDLMEWQATFRSKQLNLPA